MARLPVGLKAAATDHFIRFGDNLPKAIDQYFKALEKSAIVGGLMFASSKVNSWSLKAVAIISFILLVIWLSWIVSEAFPNPFSPPKSRKNRYLLNAFYSLAILAGSLVASLIASQAVFVIIGAFFK